MLDLSKVKLPDSVEAGGELFHIKTDFRAWLCFSRLLQKKDAVVDEADFIYEDAIPDAAHKAEAFRQLVEFFQPRRELPRAMGGAGGGRMIDYDADAELIYAAFLQQYGIDLLAVDGGGHAVQMHWHKFLALLTALNGTRLNDVMGYRSYEPGDKTPYERRMARLKAAWELPDEPDEDEQRMLDDFNALFD